MIQFKLQTSGVRRQLSHHPLLKPFSIIKCRSWHCRAERLAANQKIFD